MPRKRAGSRADAAPHAESAAPTTRPSRTKSRRKPTPPLEIQLHERVHAVFIARPHVALTLQELIEHLALSTPEAQRALHKVLKRLYKTKYLVRDTDKRYHRPQHTADSQEISTLSTPPTKKSNMTLPVIEGRVDHVAPYFAFVVAPGETQDIRVRTRQLQGAVHGDLVLVQVQAREKGDRGPQGKVLKVLERGRNVFVGHVVHSPQGVAVMPNHKRLHEPIWLTVPPADSVTPKDKVVVEVTRWPCAVDRIWRGHITQVLGPAGSHQAEMDAILLEYDLPGPFSSEVVAEAARCPDVLMPGEIKTRRDFRTVPTLTIDPEDAKDFDDALSLRLLPKGECEVGVHIADVSHYVRPDSALDAEAIRRGNSVYLVDRTIPMLPERLSNNLCSLRPHEDRPAFSAVFTLDAKSHVKQVWLGETIIHSQRRFTYDEAQAIIDTNQGEFAQELRTLHELAQQLRERRFKGGAIDFAAPETKVTLNAEGHPIGMRVKVPKPVHHLIEEFMLLANRHVAQYIAQQGSKKAKKTFLYRTHDVPDEEKYGDFVRFVKQLGYTVSPNRLHAAQAIRYLKEVLGESPMSDIVQSLAIRTMAKALYSTEAKPHFGLGFTHYTHFTSPIRRYADLQVHRLLKGYLAQQDAPSVEPYASQCLHLVAQERLAMDAERTSIRYKQVVFMDGLKGTVQEGIISSLTEWGMYVTLPQHGCEGMVALKNLTDDYYQFNAQKFCVIGQHSRKIYRLGDTVYVEVGECDVAQRTVDLMIVPK